MCRHRHYVAQTGALLPIFAHSPLLPLFLFLSVPYVCSWKVALCVMIDHIATEDARARPSRGLSPRPKAEQVRILLAAGTNVAVDR